MNNQKNINLSGMMNKRIRVTTPCSFIYCGVLTHVDDEGIIISQCKKYLERDGRLKKKHSYKSIKFPYVVDMKIELESSNEDECDDSIKFGDCGCDVEGIPMEEPEPVPAVMELQAGAVPQDSTEPPLAIPEEVLQDNNFVVIPTALHVGPNLSNGHTIPVFGAIPPPPAGNSNLIPVLLPTYCVVYVPGENLNYQE